MSKFGFWDQKLIQTKPRIEFYFPTTALAYLVSESGQEFSGHFWGLHPEENPMDNPYPALLYCRLY